MKRGLAESPTAGKAIGYREAMDHLRGGSLLADTIRLVNTNASKKALPVISTLSQEDQFQAEESNNIRCFEWAKKTLV
jgi:tRNA A37 N6-isopentenylltransferase MiaA